MLQNRMKKKSTFIWRYQKTNLSVMLHGLILKMASTHLYAQFCGSKKRICCLVDNFVISPHKFCCLRNSLQVCIIAQKPYPFTV